MRQVGVWHSRRPVYAQPMKKLGGAAILAAVMIITSGCSAPEPAPTVTVTVDAIAPSQSQAPPPSSTESSAVEECAAYETDPVAQADGGMIADQIAGAPLPEGVLLNPGVQTIASADRPGMYETVVRVCSEPLSNADLIEVGNAVAVPLAQSPAADTLTTLIITGWSPDGKYLKKDASVTADFQMYTWNPDAAAPISSNWK